MARWVRFQRRAILKNLPSEDPIRELPDPPGAVHQRGSELIAELGCIANYASDLSLKCSDLPLNDRLGRTQLLAQFRSAVAEFFKMRAAALVEQTRPKRTPVYY